MSSHANAQEPEKAHKLLEKFRRASQRDAANSPECLSHLSKTFSRWSISWMPAMHPIVQYRESVYLLLCIRRDSERSRICRNTSMISKCYSISWRKWDQVSLYLNPIKLICSCPVCDMNPSWKVLSLGSKIDTSSRRETTSTNEASISSESSQEFEFPSPPSEPEDM